MAHKIYKHVELDGMAERALAEFGADDVLAGKAALDIEAFAEFFLNVTIDYQRLSQDGRTLGLSALSSGGVEVWDEERQASFCVQTEANTIFLDDDTEHCRSDVRRRFTLAHGCGHIVLHRSLEPNASEDSLALVMKFDESFYERPLDDYNDDEFRERQANRFGAALLMPESGVRAVLNGYVNPLAGTELEDLCVPHEEVAKVFNVSAESARLRLACLKLI